MSHSHPSTQPQDSASGAFPFPRSLREELNQQIEQIRFTVDPIDPEELKLKSPLQLMLGQQIKAIRMVVDQMDAQDRQELADLINGAFAGCERPPVQPAQPAKRPEFYLQMGERALEKINGKWIATHFNPGFQYEWCDDCEGWWSDGAQRRYDVLESGFNPLIRAAAVADVGFPKGAELSNDSEEFPEATESIDNWRIQGIADRNGVFLDMSFRQAVDLAKFYTLNNDIGRKLPIVYRIADSGNSSLYIRSPE